MTDNTSKNLVGVKLQGKIVAVQGEVVIVEPNGSEDRGRAGDSLRIGSTVKTLGSSIVVISIDGYQTISLGHDESITLDDTLLALLEEITEGSLVGDINFERIANAIESGESLDDILPPTATGGDQPSSAGSSAGASARIELTGETVSPESGFETQGLTPTSIESFTDDLQHFNSQPYTSGIANFAIDEDVDIAIDLSASFFDDDPSQALTFTLENLPEGLGFDPQTGRLSGAATNDAAFTQAGLYTLTVSAMDNSGAVNDSVSTEFVLQVNNVNDAPLAGASIDLGQVEEDQSLVINAAQLLEGATDVDWFDALTVSRIDLVEGQGQVIDNGDGSFSYIPATNWFGNTEFTYSISDGQGGEANSSGRLAVVSVNDDPQVNVDGLVSTTPMVPVNVDVLENDIDVDGDNLVVVSATAGNGSVVVEDDGSITYTPNDGFFGSDLVEYRVSDGGDGEVPAILPVQVIYHPGTISLEDTVSVATSSPTFSGSSSNIIGDITLNVDDVDYVVVPAADGNWSVALSGPLTDGHYLVTASGVDILDSQVSSSDDFIVDAYAPLVTLNPIDLATALPTFSGSANHTEGELLLTVNGASYEISPDVDGTWSFTLPDGDLLPDGDYTAAVLGQDGQGNSASARDSFRVDDNFPVVAIDDLDSTDSPLPMFTGSSANIDGNLILSVNAEEYSVTPAEDGAWLFTIPDENALADGDYEVTIRGTDGQGNLSSDATRVVINAVDDVPNIIGDVSGNVDEDAAAVLLVEGDLDAVDGDPGEDSFDAETLAAEYGSLTITSEGAWEYRADNSQSAIQGLAEGQSITENFLVTNSDGATTQVIAVTINGTEDDPVISGVLAGEAVEDTLLSTSGNVTASDIDIVDNPDFVAQFATVGEFGWFSLDISGNWMFVLDNTVAQSLSGGQVVTDVFGILAMTADGESVTQSIVITISGTEDGPVISGAVAGDVTEDANLTAAGVLSAGDADAADDPAFIAQSGVAGSYGTFDLGISGGWQYVLNNDLAQSLAAGEQVFDTFTVTAATEDGENTSQTVTITVTGSNDAPVVSAAIELGSIEEDSGYFIIRESDLLAGAMDIDGNTLSVQNLAVTSGEASLVNNMDGTWAVNPGLNFNGQLIFSYQVSDGNALVDNTASLVVAPVNDEPLVAPIDLGDMNEDGVITITQANLLSGIIDIDGDFLVADELQVTEGDGTITENADGSWDFMPAADWNGEVSFGYFVVDDETIVFNSASLIVSPANDNPEVDAALESMVDDNNSTYVLNLLTDSSDIDGDSLNVSHLTPDAASVAGVTLDGNNLWIDPSAYDYLALDDEPVVLVFTYLIDDGNGGSVEQTATITIAGADDVPVITGDTAAHVIEDTADILIATGQLEASGGDAGEDRFIADSITGSFGTFSVNENGSWNYSADNNQNAIQRLTGLSDHLEETFSVINADGVTTQEIVVTIQGSDNGVPDIIVEDGNAESGTEVEQFEFDGEDFDFSPQDEAGDAANIDLANLTLASESQVTLSFVSEAASFNNSVGWYQVDASGLISDVGIIWANTNLIEAGDEVVFSAVPQGEIGFFLIQNAYVAEEQRDAIDALMAGNGLMRFEDDAGDQATTSADAPVLAYYTDGDENNPLGARTEFDVSIHGSYSNLNLDGIAHASSGLLSGDENTLVIGFEDSLALNPDDPGEVDWDLRDVVFTMQIESANLNVATVASTLEIEDDGTSLAAASVRIVLGRDGDGLRLPQIAEELSETAGIVVAYEEASRTLLLEGSATVAQYEAILSAVQISSHDPLGDNPRQIEFTATDTDGNQSAIATVNLNADATYDFADNDFMAGTDGDDTIDAILGDDIIFGGMGDDRLSGGAGTDTLIWLTGDDLGGAEDTITDFTGGVGGDILDMSDLLQGESADALVLDDYFDFAFSGADTVISVDTDGDGSGADMSIVLEGIDLTILGADQAILQSLLDDGNLITD